MLWLSKVMVSLEEGEIRVFESSSVVMKGRLQNDIYILIGNSVVC